MKHSRIKRAAAVALGLATLVVGGPRAWASQGETTVVTDPANDVTYTFTSVPATDPRVDVLSAGWIENSSSLTAVIHVTDLDAPASTLSPDSEYQMNASISWQATIVFEAARAPGVGQAGDVFVANGTGACTLDAQVVFDGIADTVSVTVSLADLGGCGNQIGTPVGKGSVLINPYVYAQSYDYFNTSTATATAPRDNDTASGTTGYTLQH